jgi:hypothetical protein
MDLISLCFKCFSAYHVAWSCPNPSCCLHCREPGHLAQNRKRPWFLLGDCRVRFEQRRPPLAPGQKRVCPPSPPLPPSPEDLIPHPTPAVFCSIDDELGLPPSICAPPSDSSLELSLSPPSSQAPPPPLMRGPSSCPQVELCIIHCFKGIIAEERALDLALVTVVGGTRPSITNVEVRG